MLHSCYRTALSNNTMFVAVVWKVACASPSGDYLHFYAFFYNFPAFPCGQMLLFNPYAGFPSDTLLLLFSM